MSKMELYQASEQWRTRPSDERFSTLEEMHAACFEYARQAREADVPFHSIRVEAADQDLRIVGRENVPATLTNYAFGQLCGRVGAPVPYLSQLPATLAAQNLNWGLAKRDGGAHRASLLFHQNGNLILRALTTEVYRRVWNHEMVALLIRLREEQNWRVPPARPAFSNQPGTRHATEEDVLRDRGSNFGLSINVGDLIAPAGLYASDHDMFAFMINEDTVIEDGSDGGLIRGFFLRGSEVGDSSIWFTGFKMRHVCGNHIVWGAQDLLEVKIRHTGDVRRVFQQEAPRLLRAYAQAGVKADQEQVNAARRFVLGSGKEDAIDAVLKVRIPELSKKRLGEAYDLAEQHADQDGSPRTVYGMVNGITRLSQKSPYADVRNTLDRAAGKVMKIAF